MDAERGGLGVALAALALLGAAGCGADGSIEVTNGAGSAVSVRLGGEDLGQTISPGGGAALLGTARCSHGPIVVTYAHGRVVELDGPICPGQTLAVSDATARIIASPRSSAGCAGCSPAAPNDRR